MTRTRARAKRRFSDDETTTSSEDDYIHEESDFYDDYIDEKSRAEDEKGSDESHYMHLDSDELSNDIEHGENNVFVLNRYWPHGLDSDEPENKNLLYLYRFKVHDVIQPCSNCSGEEEINAEKYFEVVQECMYYYKHDEMRQLQFSSLDQHPAALHEFDKDTVKKFKRGTRTYFFVVLLPYCCKDKSNIEKRHYYGDLDVRDELPQSPLLKIFVKSNMAYVYLKVDENSIPSIPKSIDYRLSEQLEIEYIQRGLPGCEKTVDTLWDTFDFSEAEIPNSFKLKLRDYQLRSVKWMQSIEDVKENDANTIVHNFVLGGPDCYIKVKLGNTPYYVSLDGKREITKSPETIKPNPLRLYGGILADDTGSGKTVTTLALIHSSPFNEDKAQQRSKRFKYPLDHFQSRASCIICPSNIYKQWLQEAKKCNPKFKIIGLSTILDHEKISWVDAMEADIIVVSYQFLRNLNYRKVENNSCSVRGEFTNYLNVKGRVVLRYLHYHRLILDEFHELEADKNVLREAVKAIKADFIWGLTGTPNINNFLHQLEYFKPSSRFETVYEENENAQSEFKRKFIKRNVPNLELPKIETETVWIDLSPQELALLRWEGRDVSTREKIMKCSHYQLTERTSVSVDSFVSVDEAQKQLSKQKENEINTFKCDLIQTKALMENMLKEKPESNVEYYTRRIRQIESDLQRVQSSFNYFNSVFKVIGEPEKNECHICYDVIPATSLAVLPCSHIYCFDCVKASLEKNRQCPLCRQPIKKVSDIYRIRIKKPEALPEKLKELDTSKYGSKLIALYKYIADLIEKDENARIILFLQYSDLADFMTKIFYELQVNCVRVVGTVFQRQNAIAKFRESKDVRLIMMSSEDSVSGINLTQATHVILLHPFFTDKGEESDLAYEKQGISRAYRFGLDHPLKVVRFAARGTIEEEITLRREKLKL